MNWGTSLPGLVLFAVLAPAAHAGPQPPTIDPQPQSQAIPAGSNAVFSAGASGQGTLIFQWLFNGTNLSDSVRITGSGTSTLTLSNLMLTDSGNYQISVTDNHGTATSSNAILTVLHPPEIIQQPSNRVAPLNGTTGFTVSNTGSSPLVYRWRKNGMNLTNGTGITGAGTSALTIAGLRTGDAGAYQVLVSNSFGSSISDEATLAVIPVLIRGFSHLTNPSPELTNAVRVAVADGYYMGSKSDGSVVVEGINSYAQTNVPPGLSDVVEISAGQSQSLALRSDKTVVAWGSNEFGQTNFPSSQSNFVAIAAGAYHSLALRESGTVFGCGYNGYGQAGVPSNATNVVAIAAGGYHNLALRGDGTVVGWGLNNHGQAAVPAGLSNVVAISACSYGSLALRSDGTVVAWGDNGAGQTNVPPGLSNVVAIAAGAAHHLALDATGKVSGWGDNAYSESIFPTNLEPVTAVSAGFYASMIMVENPMVQMPPAVWWQSSSRIVPVGGSLLLRPYLTGSLPQQFQWLFNGSPLQGETNAWLMMNGVGAAQSGEYAFIVANPHGSVTGQVMVGVSPGIVTQPVSTTIFAGSNATFSVEAAGSAPLHYQWQVKGYAVPCCWVIMNGQTNNSLTVSNAQGVQSGDLYRVVVTNVYGSVISSTGVLTVLTPPAFTVQPQSQARAVGGSVTFNAAVTGTQPISFQWYANGSPVASGGRFSVSASATTTSLTITGLTTNDSGDYQLVASNLVGVANSAMASLDVVVPPSILQQPLDQAALVGSNATFTVVADGGEPLAYQWHVNGTKLSDGGQVSGSKSNTLILSGLSSPGTNDYSVVITNVAGAVTSAPATLIVYGVRITAQPANRLIHLGSNTTFTVSAIGQSPIQYQWFFDGVPLVDDGAISGSDSDTLSLSNLQVNHGGFYSVRVSNAWTSTTSIEASLRLRPSDPGAVLHVSRTSTTPRSPYLDWDSAATNIQDAADVAIDGNLILATNGVYAQGGAYAAQAPTRVVLLRAVTLQSVNGPADTFILGGGQRGVWLGNNATLSGFTVSNGTAYIGGGVWCQPSAVVSNCLIRGNSTPGSGQSAGGGVCGGTVYFSTLTENTAYSGGGAAGSTLYNCFVSSNLTSAGGYGYGAGADSCVLSNCQVIGNQAVYSAWGGGTARGVNYNSSLIGNSASVGGGSYADKNLSCLIRENWTWGFGGGSRNSTNYNCLIIANQANRGGGVYGGVQYNCSIVGNVATQTTVSIGGGAYSSPLYNTILFNNTAYSGSNWASSALYNCCTIPGGTVTNDPGFVDSAAGDFHLLSTSPCVNAGNNDYVTHPLYNGGNGRYTNAIDFEYNPRVVGYSVDIGAYERVPAALLPNAWLAQFGYPNDGSADFVDTDGEGLNTWQEWRAGTNPTNAASALRMTGITNGTNGLMVSWESVSGRYYRLERAGDLGAPPAFQTVATNIPGVAGTKTHTDTSATNGGPFYYRVGVQ